MHVLLIPASLEMLAGHNFDNLPYSVVGDWHQFLGYIFYHSTFQEFAIFTDFTECLLCARLCARNWRYTGKQKGHYPAHEELAIKKREIKQMII